MIEKSKLLKKVLTVVLSAAMLMSAAAAVPVLPDSGLNTEVQAAETYGNFEYYEDEWENTVTITGYTGTDKVVTIPSKINNRSVTKINIFAFENNTAITKVIIPDSVTEIGMSVFSGCTSLTSVEMADSVTEIGSSSFDGCTALKSIRLSDNLKELPLSLFSKCESLETVNVPSKLEKMGLFVFYRTKWLANQPDGQVYFGKIFYSYKGEMTDNTSVTIKNGTIGIAGGAFKECKKMVSVSIPDTVTNIGSMAFSDCQSLKSVTLPKQLKETSFRLFEGCKSLTSAILPDGLELINSGTFENCYALTDIKIPDTVTKIDGYVFSFCKSLESIVIPDKVEEIDLMNFEYCTSLKSITFGKNVSKISGKAFKNCTSLEKITLPAQISFVSDEAFYGCTSLKEVTIMSKDFSVSGKPFGYYYDSENWNKEAKVSGFTIRAYAGTKAETYAKENQFIFVNLANNAKIDYSKQLAESVKLNKSSATVVKGKTVKLTATVSPTNAVDKSIKWSTSDSKIATVSGGTVKGVKAGTVTITATTSNGKKATCKVTVKNPTVAASSVKLNKTSVTLGKGKSTTIKATVNPSNATNKKVTWTTSNKNVATVKNGKITAKKIGTATIKVKTANGKKAKCKVTVKNFPTKVRLNKTSATLKVKKNLTLKASVTPSKNVISSITWTSSNKKIATVKNGKLTAKKAGTVTITAKTVNGKTAKCKIKVTK